MDDQIHDPLMRSTKGALPVIFPLTNVDPVGARFSRTGDERVIPVGCRKVDEARGCPESLTDPTDFHFCNLVFRE
jgi:hypothetical protein